MKTVSLIQGTPEWRAHRSFYFNASDAPAMLGVSPYKTRDQLIREKATGITPEVDSATQQRFDDGHRYEALARTLAESIVGDELFPCVGVDGKFSASFDGLTLLEDVAFEHKSLNSDLRISLSHEGATGAALPEHYRIQMEHQCMVSGAERVLFMASKWDGETLVEECHCWYTADLELRARIVAGWAQFEADVAAYQPEETEPAVIAVGRAPEQLPALRVEVTGMVTASNLTEFKANALAVIGGINRNLQTDEDFANADKTVKWCKDVEERLELTKQQVLGQTADIAAVFRTMDEVAEETRRVRLELDRLVKAEKERRRSEIVADAVSSVRAHYDAINATLGQHAIQAPASLQSQVGEAIKGKKTLISIREAANSAAANAKIDSSQVAERVRANVAALAEYPEHAHLFADRVQLCATKVTEDLRNLAVARIADHRAKEEAQRESIRQQEREKIDREREEAELARAAVEPAAPAMEPDQPPVAAPPVLSPAQERVHGLVESISRLDPSPAPAPITRVTVKLGDINARIAPLSITADGLATLGFKPVGTDRAARLYAESDLIAIYRSLYGVIQNAAKAESKAA
ncbi:MAG: YqaJ viral recombinase family protein [Dyella sp.]